MGVVKSQIVRLNGRGEQLPVTTIWQIVWQLPTISLRSIIASQQLV